MSGLQAGCFAVSDISFAPDRQLPWHEHPRACAAVVLEGCVLKRFRRREADAAAGSLVLMPPLEPHEDLFGREGARIVVVEADAGFVERSTCIDDWTAMLIAVRMARELALADEFSSLALEGLAFELTAIAGRASTAPHRDGWLQRAKDVLSERCLAPPTAAELAAEVGVHPSHLARAFRARYGDSLGGYARRMRLEWAAGRVASTDVALARLAREAGFVDQSHFTRAFRREFGLTPARFRQAHR